MVRVAATSDQHDSVPGGDLAGIRSVRDQAGRMVLFVGADLARGLGPQLPHRESVRTLQAVASASPIKARTRCSFTGSVAKRTRNARDSPVDVLVT
jgi:hypothetical protein